MSGSTFGRLFTVTTWGESHGPAIGAVIDGCPAGLPLSAKDIQPYLNRRKPGQSRYSTARQEDDKVQILSGVFEGFTTGTPISVMIYNHDQRSRDYSNVMDTYRPGHADYTYDAKYGFRDYRGGGRSSGRETIGRVAAGAIASKLLASLGIRLTAYTRSIGAFCIPEDETDLSCIFQNSLYMPSMEWAKKASEYLESCIKELDSSGGTIECLIDGVPAGIGDPVFEKLDASLAKAVMSIGAVKGVEIGEGFASSLLLGSQNNDPFYCENGQSIQEEQPRRRHPGRHQRRQPDHSPGSSKTDSFYFQTTADCHPQYGKYYSDSQRSARSRDRPQSGGSCGGYGSFSGRRRHDCQHVFPPGIHSDIL